MSASFQYPRSGVLLAELLHAMGHGPKSWPRRSGISAKTVSRIASDQPAVQSQDEFLDAALGLLGSASGHWQFNVLPRDATLALLRTGLRDYDLAVSQLNADMSRITPDHRHALPILVILAVRIGVWIGVLAAHTGETVDALWSRSPLDPLAFGRAIDHYAALALPGESQRNRRLACDFGKNTVDRWHKRGPGRLAKLAGLPKFAAWVAEKVNDSSASKIEWHLRWLAAGSRLRERLDEYLGNDGTGRPWVDRVWQTARMHAELNHAIHSDKDHFATILAQMDQMMAPEAKPEQALVFRRLFAWICDRTRALDGSDGVALTADEMIRLRALLDTDEQARHHVWARFGLLHALGFPAISHLGALATMLRGEALQQYTFHTHQPQEFLWFQHLQLAAVLSQGDPDDVLAACLHIPFSHAEARRYEARALALLRELPVDPAELPAMFVAHAHFAAHQQRLAGLPAPPLPPVTDLELPANVRESIALLDLQRTLPQMHADGGDAAVEAELERMIQAYPTMVEPALMLLSSKLEQLLELDIELHQLQVTNAMRLAVNCAPQPGTRAYIRDLLQQRRRTRSVRVDFEQHFQVALDGLDVMAEQIGDRWHVDLLRATVLGRRAGIAVIAGSVINRDKAPRRDLATVIHALTNLHAVRPDHPAPCLWLARFTHVIGDRNASRHWTRLALHRGETSPIHA